MIDLEKLQSFNECSITAKEHRLLITLACPTCSRRILKIRRKFGIPDRGFKVEDDHIDRILEFENSLTKEKRFLLNAEVDELVSDLNFEPDDYQLIDPFVRKSYELWVGEDIKRKLTFKWRAVNGERFYGVKVYLPTSRDELITFYHDTYLMRLKGNKIISERNDLFILEPDALGCFIALPAGLNDFKLRKMLNEAKNKMKMAYPNALQKRIKLEDIIFDVWALQSLSEGKSLSQVYSISNNAKECPTPRKFEDEHVLRSKIARLKRYCLCTSVS